MNKVYFYGVFVSICLLLYGCTDKRDVLDINKHSNNEGSYIIRSRSKSLPSSISERKIKLKKGNQLKNLIDNDSPYRYMGYGYKVGNGIIGDPANITFPVIYDEALLNDKTLQRSYNKIDVRKSVSEVYVFSDYNEYLSNSVNSEKFSANFSLPSLFPFKLGFDASFEKIFEHNIKRTQHQVKGLVNLMYKESNVQLNTTPLVINKIVEKCLDPLFIQNIHNISMYEVIKSYGGYVVCNYAVGGRATAQYLYNTASDTDEVIHKLKNTLNMSFGWGARDSTSSVGFGLSLDKVDDNKAVKEWKTIVNKIQVDGGNPSFALSTSVKEIEKNTIDLSDWSKSLNEKTRLVMIDINKQGLLELDHFVIEENYQKLIRDINSGLQRLEKNQIPYFTIENISSFSNGKTYKRIASVLNTRNGDKVIFASKDNDNSKNEFKKEAERLGSDISKIFDGIEVKGVPNSNFNTLIRTYKTSVVVQYELKDLNWLKYKNPQTNIVYIYDPDKRIAISYYDDDDEYISDLYGLSDWVKSLTEKKISMSLLRQNYQVIGL